MAYGLKYQNEFNSRSDNNGLQHTYFLQFWFKDYTGPATSVLGGETSVIQRCTIDDPTAPIKGQSLDITLINENGNLPIINFQSEDDNGVQVQLLEGTKLLFIGYLVQDDFYETKVDTTHTITLSANDGLGLLKGVILSDAAVRRAFEVSLRTNGDNSVVYIWSENTAFYPQIGNTIEILGVSYVIAIAVNETTGIGPAFYNWTITLTTPTAGIGPTIETVYLTGEIDLLLRNSLLSTVAVCLGQTNLALITNIFLNHCEYRQNPMISTFEQTLLDSQIFISGDTYQDCYTALSKVLTSFNCTLFQANGQWNIVHWPEFRRWANNAVPGFMYDETWSNIGSTLFNNTFNIGTANDTTWLSGLQQGALRGWKFSRQSFEFKQPKYLLKNSDLMQLGTLLRTYDSGTDTISEYVALYWQRTNNLLPAVERFIRVVYDNVLRRESDRYLVLRGPTYDSTRSLPSEFIECQTNDRIRFSCTFRTNVGGTIGALSFAIQLYDGTTTRYLYNGDDPIRWAAAFGFSITFPAGTDSGTWHDIDTELSPPIPYNGLMTVFLPEFTDPPQNSGRESHFKNMQFEYVSYINDSTKIIGQIHNRTQDVNKKLNNDVDILIDDTPRNSIQGTLFLTTKTPATAYGLQDRTAFWRYPNAPSGDRHLGELNTYEELLYKRVTRSKFEGGFFGNYQAGVTVSLLTMAIMEFSPNKNYTFGLLTIDYKKNQFSGTLYELYDLTDAELVSDYTLTYKYSTT